MSHEDCKEDKKYTTAEDWRKPISDPVTKFSDSVNADETTITVDKPC
jgi:hypothetical protein